MSELASVDFSSGPLAGAWFLRCGAVTSRHIGRASLLRIAQGAAWVTVGTSDGGTPDACGDFFLQSGDVLSVPAGALVVVESEGRGVEQAHLRFDWVEPAAPLERFATALAQPAGDLVSSLRQVRLASVGVVRGLTAYLASLVVARRSQAPCLVSPRRP